MPASPQDFYKKVGANTVTTLAAPGKNLAATSINVGATTNYPTDTGIVVGIRVVDSNGTIVPGTYTEWNAVVASSTAITIEAVPVYGTDQVYPAGSLTQVFLMVSSSLHNQMVDGLLVSHDQDSKLKAGAISNSNMLANNTVTTAAITDASVTTAKMQAGFTRRLGLDSITTTNTLLTTSSVAYLTVTATTTGGEIEVDVRATMVNGDSGASRKVYAQVFRDGTSISTQSTQSVGYASGDGVSQGASYSVIISDTPSAASHTYTVKLKASANSSVYLAWSSLKVSEVS